MSRNDDFFQSPKEHSRIKLRVLEKFIRPWASKVGGYGRSTAPLYIVDGYAGEGRYSEDSTLGSAGLILTVADELQRVEGVSRRLLRPVLVEKVKWRYDRLKSVAAEFPAVHAMVIRGDFWEHVDDVIREVHGAPLLLLLDPFGIKGIILDEIARISNASRKTDLLFTFMSSAVPRLEEQYPQEMRWALGRRLPGEGPAAAFGRNLCRDAQFIAAGRFEVKQSFKAKAKYEMMVFSRHIDAYHLLNDFMTDEAQAQALTLPAPTTQPALPGVWEETAASTDFRNCAEAILGWAVDRQAPFFRRALLEDFYTSRFASYNTKVLIAALKELGKKGQLMHDGGLVESQLWRLPP